MAAQNLPAFDKMVATGNDFIFIDARKGLPEAFQGVERARIALKICDRHFGAGADGLVFVESTNRGDLLRWDFYNNDGSSAEMCGNASRCMGRWGFLHLGRSQVEFETQAGVVRAEALPDGRARSHLNYIEVKFAELNFGRGQVATFVNTGVPHSVIEVPTTEGLRSDDVAIRELRFHAKAGPRGTNVTFFSRREGQASGQSENRISTVTFERGVENFTLSCGTGVLAAAAVSLRATRGQRVLVSTRGGELEVSFGDQWRGATLTGAADRVYEAKVTEEFLRWLKQ